MITAVDSNILFDLLISDAPHQEESRERLLDSAKQGAVIIGEAVYAELAVRFSEKKLLDEFLVDADLRMQLSNSDALFTAGEMWHNYARRRAPGLTCTACGKRQTITCTNCGSPIRSRQRVLADFLIGAHAQVHADRLLTRDLGYYKTYFPALKLV